MDTLHDRVLVGLAEVHGLGAVHGCGYVWMDGWMRLWMMMVGREESNRGPRLCCAAGCARAGSHVKNGVHLHLTGHGDSHFLAAFLFLAASPLFVFDSPDPSAPLPLPRTTHCLLKTEGICTATLDQQTSNIGMDHGDGGHGGHGGGGGGGGGGGDGGGGGGGGHGDHGGDDMTCSMNMLFNWSTENLCVVFESWRINTPFALVLSCLVIIAMSASYELLRAQSRQFEERLIEGDRKRHAESRGAVSGGIAEDETPLLSPRPHVLRSVICIVCFLLSCYYPLFLPQRTLLLTRLHIF